MYANSVKYSYQKLDNPKSCVNLAEYYDGGKYKGPFEQCYGIGVRTDDAVDCCLKSCSGSTKECNESCTDNAWKGTNFQKCVDELCTKDDKVVNVGDNRYGKDCVSREGENLIKCCMNKCNGDTNCVSDCNNIKNAMSYFQNKKSAIMSSLFSDDASSYGFYAGIGLFAILVIIVILMIRKYG